MLRTIMYSFLCHRSKCGGFFDFGCHIQYVCASWILLFGLLTASIPTGTFCLYRFLCSFLTCWRSNKRYGITAIVLLWLLHQKGLFDPIYDWWNGLFGASDQRNRIHSKIAKDVRPAHLRHRKGNGHDVQYKHMLKPPYDRKKRKPSHSHHALHKHGHPSRGNDHYHLNDNNLIHLHQVGHKHKHTRSYLTDQGHKASKSRVLSMEMEDMKHRKTNHNDDRELKHKHVLYRPYEEK